MNQKTALVIGCTGQDGSLISRSLLTKGYKVIGTTRRKEDNKKNLFTLDIEKDIRLIETDISSFRSCSNLIDKYFPEEIYNLAAQSSVGKSFVKPQETIDSIVTNSINLLEVTRQNRYESKLFFAGSSEMFGNTEKAADINHSQNPISPYAIAKQTCFKLVKLYREIYKLNCVTGVLFNHESPLREGKFVIQKIINAAKKISKSEIDKIQLGNIDIIRDWGWANEYVEAMQLINNAEDQKDYVICTGTPTKLREIIIKIFEKYNLNYLDHLDINPKLIRPNEIIQSYGNPRQLEEDLNWVSKTNINLLVDNLIGGKI